MNEAISECRFLKIKGSYVQVSAELVASYCLGFDGTEQNNLGSKKWKLVICEFSLYLEQLFWFE